MDEQSVRIASEEEITESPPTSEPLTKDGIATEIPKIPWPSWDAPATEWLSNIALRIILFAGTDVWGFVFTTLLCLSPLLVGSLLYTIQLLRDVQKKEQHEKLMKKRERRAKRNAAKKND